MNLTTQARVDNLVALATTAVHQGDEAALRRAIEMALKYQDRDTRHACAEAVAALSDADITYDGRNALNRAHGVCMNAHAI